MWYFASPREIVYGEEALSHLHYLRGSRAFIVTDAVLASLGIVGRIESLLQEAGFETLVFAEVEPEPSLNTVKKGAAAAAEFKPDWFVALGGGSPMDAAKAIWVLYERPDLDPTEINPMDVLGLNKAKLLAIPTTSGTGSEVTWALVLTDTEEKRKFSTGSREVIPHVAIIDPSLTRNLPPRIAADTGLDALTHAIEGYVSQWHNVFSDGMCLKAAQLVFENLRRVYCNGVEDVDAREAMGNAAAMAGLGFGNSMLGLAHAMGHSLGAFFKLPHGRAVSLFLPYTIEFTVNGGLGDRYADIVRFNGWSDGRDIEAAGRLLVLQVRELQTAVEQPQSIAALGIERTDFDAALETLVMHAEMDTQFFTAPRIPDSDELARMFMYIYDGKPLEF